MTSSSISAGKVFPLSLARFTSALFLAGVFFSLTPSANHAQPYSFKTPEARGHFEKALLFSEKAYWNAAVLELNRALQYEPGNPSILIELGIASGELQQWNQAVHHLTRAAELSP